MDYQLLNPVLDENLTPIEQIFYNRGIEPNDINHYLHPTKEDILDPLLLENMREGAQLLVSHLYNLDEIFIQVDADVDGYTSAACLLNYLNKIAPGIVQNKITYRIHEGKQHGILLDTIPANTKLVIIPDAGSDQVEEHKALKEQGIDILVLDHHIITKPSNYACIINNQLSYPNKTLSGVGVVYKLCQYLDSLLNTNYSNDLIDLVAVGIVSDMVDLRNFETRELINLGVLNIKNPFLSAFVQEQEYSLKGELTPFGISFYIAPYINATIRVGTQSEKKLLFESMLEFKAYDQVPSTKRGCKGQYETKIEQACRNCKNIKSRQTKTRDTSLEIIEKIIERDNLLDSPIIIIQLDNPVDENLTGLMANQIMGQYMRPVLLLNKCLVDGKIYWRGSGRNSTYSKLKDLRKFLEDSGYTEYSAGHEQAFGISISEENFDNFKKYITDKLKDFDFSNYYRVDFIWRASEIDKQIFTILEIGKLNSLWGQGLPEPKIAIENINVNRDNLILMSPDKKPTLKITLSNNLSLIKFGSSQEEYEKLYSDLGCVTINIVGTCNLNVWNGNINPQIFIEDYKIVSNSTYYF